jgi:hypothetical protein
VSFLPAFQAAPCNHKGSNSFTTTAVNCPDFTLLQACQFEFELLVPVASTSPLSVPPVPAKPVWFSVDILFLLPLVLVLALFDWPLDHRYNLFLATLFHLLLTIKSLTYKQCECGSFDFLLVSNPGTDTQRWHNPRTKN